MLAVGGGGVVKESRCEVLKSKFLDVAAGEAEAEVQFRDHVVTDPLKG
jgi:hypothetical protein